MSRNEFDVHVNFVNGTICHEQLTQWSNSKPIAKEKILNEVCF